MFLSDGICAIISVMIIVIDTSVFVGALLSADGANREVCRRCLLGQFQPLMGTALLAEYEDLLGRESLFVHCPVDVQARIELFEALMSVAKWTKIYYGWRPNLRDEGDNHLVELAVAGVAGAIVTNNVRDLERGELRFPWLRILTPAELIQRSS
ncbi:MAG: putative toxin-antitoxin system toxin component, PIN family [Magnetococcus sp. DMHC-1]